MLMPDVNILLYAHREADPRHDAYAEWVNNLANGQEPYALSVLVAAGFVRVATSPKIADPTPSSVALAFIDELILNRRCRVVSPGSGHLQDFARLCRATGASGTLVADAQHAAVAIEHGATWVSADR